MMSTEGINVIELRAADGSHVEDSTNQETQVYVAPLSLEMYLHFPFSSTAPNVLSSATEILTAGYH
jgi:hypothetical protein